MSVGNKISGKDGSVKHGSGATAIKITKWDVTKTADVQDNTDSGDAATGYKANLPSGWKGWNGSFEGFLLGGVAQPEFGSIIPLELIADGNIKYTGNAIINSEATSLGVVSNESVKVAYQFQGTGALTKTDTTA
jgi:hypothetical protein